LLLAVNHLQTVLEPKRHLATIGGGICQPRVGSATGASGERYKHRAIRRTELEKSSWWFSVLSLAVLCATLGASFVGMVFLVIVSFSYYCWWTIQNLKPGMDWEKPGLSARRAYGQRPARPLPVRTQAFHMLDFVTPKI